MLLVIGGELECIQGVEGIGKVTLFMVKDESVLVVEHIGYIL